MIAFVSGAFAHLASHRGISTREFAHLLGDHFSQTVSLKNGLFSWSVFNTGR